MREQELEEHEAELASLRQELQAFYEERATREGKALTNGYKPGANGAKAPVPIKSRCVCVSFANDIPNPRPLHAPKTFADVQSGLVALMVVVDCVRPPRRRTLCRRRDLVIIQEARRRRFGSAGSVHALQAVTRLERHVVAGSTVLNSAARDLLADCTALFARQELHFTLEQLYWLAAVRH